MNRPESLIWCTVLTLAVAGPAMVTDLRWRRIPNFLTFPALGAAFLVRALLFGWSGLALGLAGAVISPLLLWVLHGGRGLGMGDLKLAAAIGAIAGPLTAAVMIFLSTLIGGILAIVVTFYASGLFSQLIKTLLIGFPFGKKKRRAEDKHINATEDSSKVLTMPYGLAIGIGSLLTLAVSWWTGQEDWFLSIVKIAGKQ